MRVAELNFTVMYQKYITIEADDLTELLKDKIEVHKMIVTRCVQRTVQKMGC